MIRAISVLLSEPTGTDQAWEGKCGDNYDDPTENDLFINVLNRLKASLPSESKGYINKKAWLDHRGSKATDSEALGEESGIDELRCMGQCSWVVPIVFSEGTIGEENQNLETSTTASMVEKDISIEGRATLKTFLCHDLDKDTGLSSVIKDFTNMESQDLILDNDSWGIGDGEISPFSPKPEDGIFQNANTSNGKEDLVDYSIATKENINIHNPAIGIYDQKRGQLDKPTTLIKEMEMGQVPAEEKAKEKTMDIVETELKNALEESTKEAGEDFQGLGFSEKEYNKMEFEKNGDLKPGISLENPDAFTNTPKNVDLDFIGELSKGDSIHEFQFVEQLAQNIKMTLGRKNTELEIQVKPEHLGRIILKVALEDGIFSGKILAGSEPTREILERNIENLRVVLKEEGFVFSSLDVDVGNQPSPGKPSYLPKIKSSTKKVNMPLESSRSRTKTVLDLNQIDCLA